VELPDSSAADDLSISGADARPAPWQPAVDGPDEATAGRRGSRNFSTGKGALIGVGSARRARQGFGVVRAARVRVRGARRLEVVDLLGEPTGRASADGDTIELKVGAWRIVTIRALPG